MSDSEPKGVPQDLQPFNAQKEIRRSDIQLAVTMHNQGVAQYGSFSPSFARDIAFCVPETREKLECPSSAVETAIARATQYANQSYDMNDIGSILKEASALRELFPDIDPGVFNLTIEHNRRFMDFTGEILTRALEDARQKGVMSPHHPFRDFPETIGDYHILTRDTQFALDFTPPDEQESLRYFTRALENTTPNLTPREDLIASALRRGATHRILFPDSKLRVSPEFWKEARGYLNAQRPRFDVSQVNDLKAQEIGLRNAMPRYLAIARKLVLLAR